MLNLCFRAAALLFPLIFFTVSCRNVDEMTPESASEQCRRNLRSAEVTVKEYYQEKTVYPESLETAYAAIGFSDPDVVCRMLACPGRARAKPPSVGIAARVGYHYIDWSKWFDSSRPAPSNFPLLYDTSLSNHSGKGINIVFLDGSLMWDDGAQWLRKFVSEHPQYGLPIP